MLKVIVTGCPRSGTSMAAKMLHKSGLSMGDKFLKGPNNPHGFFEDMRAVKINMDLLGKDGEGHRRESWNKEHLSLLEPRPQYIKRVREFLDRYPDEGFKDPRLVRTWPVWERVLPKHTLLIVTEREPDAIKRSMMRVTGWNHVRTEDPDYCIEWHQTHVAAMLRTWPMAAVLQFDDFLTTDGQQRIRDTLAPFLPDLELQFGSVMGQRTERKEVARRPRYCML